MAKVNEPLHSGQAMHSDDGLEQTSMSTEIAVARNVELGHDYDPERSNLSPGLYCLSTGTRTISLSGNYGCDGRIYAQFSSNTSRGLSGNWIAPSIISCGLYPALDSKQSTWVQQLPLT